MLSPGRGKGLVPWPKNGMCGFKDNVWFRIQTFYHETTASTDLESTISADSTYSKDRIHAQAGIIKSRVHMQIARVGSQKWRSHAKPQAGKSILRVKFEMQTWHKDKANRRPGIRIKANRWQCKSKTQTKEHQIYSKLGNGVSYFSDLNELEIDDWQCKSKTQAKEHQICITTNRKINSEKRNIY